MVELCLKVGPRFLFALISKYMPKLELVVISIKSDDYKFIKFGIKLHNPSKIRRNQQLHHLKHMYKVQIVYLPD